MPTIYQAAFGTLPADLAATCARTRERAEARRWGYQMRELPAIGDPRARCNASDVLRFEILAETPYAIWCDTDCEILDGFEYVDDGLPHMGYFPAISRPECKAQPDVFLAYGPCEWWAARLTEAKESGILQTYCWPRRLLRDRPEIVPIPHEQWAHGMATGGKHIDPVTGTRRTYGYGHSTKVSGERFVSDVPRGILKAHASRGSRTRNKK